jgi:hypothetical protein
MSQNSLHTLNERLKLLSNSGRNIVVGWRHDRDMVWLCAAPMPQVLAEAPEHPRILRGSRQLGQRTFDQICRALNTAPTKLRLDRPIGEFGSDIRPAEIDRLVRCYGAYETAHRGAGLFDIVGFTKLSPLEQMAQLNILESTLNLVQARMQSRNLPVDFARSTTGDGFYIWNRNKGLLEDICTYVLMILTLAEIKYMRDVKRVRFVPTLRAGFNIGPHYSYHQIVGSNTAGNDHIVGDLTIKLARMMEKTLPNQILISDFVRPTENGDVSTLGFIMQSLAVKQLLSATRIGHILPTEIHSYLTGSTGNGTEFNLHRYVITDKHAYRHSVFNAKSTIHHNESERVHLGLKGTDLGDFKADVEMLDATHAFGAMATTASDLRAAA